MAFGDGPDDEALRGGLGRLLRPAEGRGRPGLQGLQPDAAPAARRRLPVPHAEPRPGVRPRAGDQGPALSADPRVLHARRASSAATAPTSPISRRGSTGSRPTGSPATGARRASSTSPCRGRDRTEPGTAGAVCTSRSATSPRRTSSAHQLTTEPDGSFELFIGGPQRRPNWLPDHARLTQAVHPPGLRRLGRGAGATADRACRHGRPTPLPTPATMIAAMDWAGDFLTGLMERLARHSRYTYGGVDADARQPVSRSVEIATRPTRSAAGRRRT